MLESLYLNLGQHDALSEEEKALLAGAMSLKDMSLPAKTS